MNKEQAIQILNRLYVTHQDIEDGIYTPVEAYRINDALDLATESLDNKQGAGTIRQLTKEDLAQQQRNLKAMQEENRKRHEYYTRFR